MHLLLRLGLLGLHTAWALNAGAVEARSDPAAETSPDGQPPTIADDGPVRRPESSSPERLSQQRHHAGDVDVAADDGLVSSAWGRGEEEGVGVGEGEAQGEPSAFSRALLGLPWFTGRAKEQERETRPDTPMVSRLKSGASSTNSTNDYAGEWKGAGGLFGLSADWREAILLPDQGAGGVGARHMSLRGEACMTEEKRAEVQGILDRRRTAPPTNKVAVCVRTKDYGRFLPEWVAFHYAAGVDEITVYDDDSVDNTKEILEPFVKAGIVRYVAGKIEHRQGQMRPLNHCLNYHQQRRKKKGGRNSPRWVLFHDTDEYLFPADTDLSIVQALEPHENICCVLVKRLQYGSGGHDEMPRGLMLEEFLMHNHPVGKFNGNAKVIVNLDPTEPELGTIKAPLKSMHNGEGCECHGASTNGVSDLRINHYLGSIGDYMDRTVRYWEEKRMGEKGEMTAEKTVLQRDTNDLRSDEIVHWACATREILHRVVESLDLDDDGDDDDDVP